MAKGKKTGGKDWKPGESGNLEGRPAVPEEVKILRKLTPTKLQEIADLILDGDKAKLSAIAASSTEPAIRVAYAKATLNAMAKGDLTQIELILARLIGKAPDKLAFTDPNGEAAPLSDNERAAKMIAFLGMVSTRKGE